MAHFDRPDALPVAKPTVLNQQCQSTQSTVCNKRKSSQFHRRLLSNANTQRGTQYMRQKNQTI